MKKNAKLLKKRLKKIDWKKVRKTLMKKLKLIQKEMKPLLKKVKKSQLLKR